MIETLHLFRPLNEKLIELLKTLSMEQWQAKTVAGNWTVKDVAAHLLDTNIRFISIHRDGVMLQPDRALNSYADVVAYLNQLNADWVKAMKRVSPRQLIDFLENTHEEYIRSLESLDLNAPAMFSVAWAGEEVSSNWFHIARDYTEKWHHQQQIRHAINQQAILTKEFYKPVLDTFMRALPFRYKDVAAPSGSCIQITVESPAGGSWFIQKEIDGWVMTDNPGTCSARVVLPADLAWQLFTKAIRYEQVKSQIAVHGEFALVLPVLNMITVMA